MTGVPVLHGYWRSGATYRLRIALALKGICYEQINHDLRTGAHRASEYLSLNPQSLVPSLAVEDLLLTQSLAILEWLDETYPEPAILPPQTEARAIVRSMANLVCCDIHPINNLRVLNALREDFGATETQIQNWIGRWITTGFEALEIQLRTHGGAFAYGDTVTLADCCIVPQVYAAKRFGIDLSHFPLIERVHERCSGIESFQQAHPDVQPDAS